MSKHGGLIISLFFLGCAGVGNTGSGDLPSEMRIIFASGSEAGSYLRTEDAFLLSMSPFDRSVRLQTSREISKAEHIDYVSRQVLDWTAREEEKIRDIMVRINQALSEYSLSFPDEIIFIKTTGLEEGTAAYCRGNNIIVLPGGYLDMPFDRLYDLVLHELFHIYSRNNSEVQEALYGILAFKKCGELQLPDDIFRQKITNPDAAVNCYYFPAAINGSEYKLMPILLASSDYDEEKGGEFFDYLVFNFIAVSENGDAVVPLRRNNQYVLFTPNQVPEYLRLAAGNTGYIIHPEEVLADNFVFLINEDNGLPDMEIIHKIRAILLSAAR